MMASIEKEELNQAKDQANEFKSLYELHRSDLERIEEISKRAASMTRNELVKAIKQIDEMEQRPRFRR